MLRCSKLFREDQREHQERRQEHRDDQADDVLDHAATCSSASGSASSNAADSPMILSQATTKPAARAKKATRNSTNPTSATAHLPFRHYPAGRRWLQPTSRVLDGGPEFLNGPLTPP